MVKQRLRSILRDRVWWICLVIVFLWMLIFGNSFLAMNIRTYNDMSSAHWNVFLREYDLRFETMDYIETHYAEEMEAAQAEFRAAAAEEMPKVKAKTVSITTQNQFMMLLCLMIPVGMSCRHLMDKQKFGPRPALKQRMAMAALACVEGVVIVLALHALVTGLLVGKWMIHAKLGGFHPVGGAAWFWVLWVKPVVVALLWLPPLQCLVFLCREFIAPTFVTILVGLVLGFFYYYPLSTDLFRLPFFQLPFERWLEPSWSALPVAMVVSILWAAFWCALGALLWDIRGRKVNQ